MIRVLVVDDSLTVRRALERELSKYNDIRVVGNAADPYEARELVAMHQPDVITLDLEMPRMGGLEFLERLMQHHPLPVIVVSSIAREKGEVAMRALDIGAVEVIQKPDAATSLPDLGRRLVSAVRTASRARIRPASVSRARVEQRPMLSTRRVIAIGASTGGTRAIERIVRAVPGDLPGLLIAQHLPAAFTASFARRLNAVSALDIREACEGDVVCSGTALVAPGGKHMVVRDDQGTLRVHLHEGPAVHYQKPSIDVLFDSVSKTAGPDAVGVLLTGMGVDGARGLRSMRDAGGHTIAESEESCVVFGMPREAIALGAAVDVAELEAIPGLLVHSVSAT